MLWWSMLVFFGVKRSNDPIPNGQYCYKPDIAKNKARTTSTYHIIPCKYYKSLGRGYNGCSYEGIITDDTTFDDQCKICAIKEEWE